jgi:nucleotide-binding universal stress UspA family protein
MPNDSLSEPDALSKIVLATDLSARGDRALERAIAMAAEAKAQLIIVHAFEEFEESGITYGKRPAPSWRRPWNAVETAKHRIRQGLRADLGDAVDQARLLIEDGDPAEVIERVANSERVGLVIVGIAREGLFASRPVVLGRTVEQLIRRLYVPILIVRNRARLPYQHIVVATDFSEASAYALRVALRFFRSETLYLLHASVAPYSNHVSDPQRHADSYKQTLAEDFDKFVASLSLPDDDKRRLVTVIEPGPPEQIVPEYVHVRGADLVVLGTHGRGAMLEIFLGSTAKEILSSLPCDALVVRQPR